MARTKQTARKSTGGKAPRKQLASRTPHELRRYMTSQQTFGTAVRADGNAPQQQSYLNHENVIGAFGFETGEPTEDKFQPRYSVATIAHPQTGIAEHWLSVQFQSCYDGDGFKTHRRPPLSLMFVLDISGSMASGLEDEQYRPFVADGKSKLDAAKRCLLAILEQLDHDDSVGVLLFNHDTHLLHPPSAVTPTVKAEIATKLCDVRPGGGTRLEAGFVDGMKLLQGARGDQPLRRLYFLTDMQSHVSDEAGVLAHAKRQATPGARDGRAAPLHTTIVGMGVDLSVGTVEAISSLPGGKYSSVSTAAEFEKSIASEFCHDVVPIAFGITLALGGGWTFDGVFGSAELNALAPGSGQIVISSEFASPRNVDGLACGGVMLAKLKPPVAGAACTSGAPASRAKRATRHSSSAVTAQLPLTATWTTLEGHAALDTTDVGVPPLGPTSQIGSAALRKGLALVRFVDLQKSFCDAGGDGEAPSAANLAARLVRLDGYKTGRDELLGEMRALGDATLLAGGANHAFLETLEQIITLETSETAELQQKLDTAASNAPAAAGAARGGRKRARGDRAAGSGEPPKELVCPILHTLMRDPVSTADGHTFERSAIATWLDSRNTSPLTGLRLANKSLTPNHVVRALADSHANAHA